MKRLITTAFVYMLGGLLAGAFYREFTKYMKFEGETALAFVHTHTIVLGTLMFLILALFAASTDLLRKEKQQRVIRLYNIATISVILMMVIRGIVDVVVNDLSRGLDMSISGVAGLSHVLMTVAAIFLFNLLRKVKPTPNAYTTDKVSE